MKINVKSLDMYLYKADATPTTLVPTAITKADPPVVTVPSTAGLSAGFPITFAGTDYESLDGYTYVVGEVTSGTEFTVLGVDTTDETAVLGSSPTIDFLGTADRVKLCLSSIDIAAPTVNQIDVSTYCSEDSIPGRATPGQITFNGYVDDSAAYLDEIIAADDDGANRIFLITTKTDQGYFIGGVTLAGMGYTFPLEGAVGFSISGSQTQKIVYVH